MSKIIAIIVIAILAGGALVASMSPNDPAKNYQLTDSPESTPPPEVSPGYRAVIAGKAVRDDGTEYSFTTYRSPDGSRVDYEVERRKTVALAEKALRKRIRETIKVIEDTRIFDKHGRATGRRLVLEGGAVHGMENKFWIIRNTDERIDVIESGALQAAVGFERLINFTE